MPEKLANVAPWPGGTPSSAFARVREMTGLPLSAACTTWLPRVSSQSRSLFQNVEWPGCWMKLRPGSRPALQPVISHQRAGDIGCNKWSSGSPKNPTSNQHCQRRSRSRGSVCARDLRLGGNPSKQTMEVLFARHRPHAVWRRTCLLQVGGQSAQLDRSDRSWCRYRAVTAAM